ncbi:hypothetical protein [Roseomonas indoligenes]|uniref:Uncharacterized protein n=1 Tax=Roseomonas indoligenes TaxID=2820811 RepID=A0A940N6H7_9PROT|nr:hypothetical protein [Pararoseomonas indoligenes]MBP0495022.1 hypothetical protein [Pararoseomonas indoligenes]
MTAGQAVRDALRALSARRIGLVSPYPDVLARAAIGSWEAQGFGDARVSDSTLRRGASHPIYAMDSTGAQAVLEALDPVGLDAIVMLGRGMPTLRPILAHRMRDACPCCPACCAWLGAA